MQFPFETTTLNGAAALWRWYEQMDKVRRLQGIIMDAAGFGPQEMPSRDALRRPGLVLKAYGDTARSGPVVLMVPAPIKRAYIWDLTPETSVVAQFLADDMRPYLLQWEEPDPAFGLDDYADRLMLTCVDAIRTETDEDQVFLVGHSLGGVLAAIFASLHPQRLKGLVILTTPLHFDVDPAAGVLGPVMADLSRSGLLEAAPGNVPGSFLSLASFLASPMTFGRDRWADWLRSCAASNAMRMHLRVERWSLDELSLARRFVADIATRLYREDGFLRGTLKCGRRTASARGVVAPLLIVADQRCAIVPPEAVLPFLRTAGAADKRLLWYEGDVGVAIQHVGVLVGRNAQRHLWPEIRRWVHARHWKHSPSRQRTR
jgi:polyhydroxyalkanoate synthase subunit PhaC